ncbi:MAG TPA: hypothetical protein VIR34_13170 [Gemmatimonadaceae bacterium]
MHDRAGLLPEWAVSELRRPVATSDLLRERVMARVRAAARPPAAVSAPTTLRAAARSGRRLPVSGALLALAASVAWLAFTSMFVRSHSDFAPALGAPSGRMMVLGDTVDSALHDTLRLVRFVLHAPGAARVAIAGDFNDWSRTATPLSDSAGAGVWSTVVALPRGSRSYAFVVDDAQWVRAERIDSAASPSPPLPAAPVGGDST